MRYRLDGQRAHIVFTSVLCCRTGKRAHEILRLISRLEHAGYGDIIRSWIGEGRNEPIAPQEIGAALGPHAAELSRNSGLPREALIQEEARLLPMISDRLTPHGKLPHTLVAP